MSGQSFISTFAQLCLDLVGSHSPATPTGRCSPPEIEPDDEEAPEETEDGLDDGDDSAPRGRDPELERQCREMLAKLGIVLEHEEVTVHWNSRLRSTAGYAAYPSWRIQLNPRLIPFEGQVERTLKHELAHLIAYFRAKRRRIEPHGTEWRQACADLGIPGEPAHHRLPFPRSTMRRNHNYQCPSCLTVVGRVRPFKRATACLACCRKYARGAFDPRFKFVKVQSPARE